MEIAIHLGVHHTDDDHLIRCLMRNRPALGELGIAVPGPGQYRQQLRKLAHDMRDMPTDALTQEALLDGILDDDHSDRIVLSWDGFLSLPQWVIGNGHLYHSAGSRVAQLTHLFPKAEVSLFMGLRNPATFLPALVRADPSGSVQHELDLCDLAALRWSTVVNRIVQVNPGLQLTVWCDEDAPLLWPQILRAVADHPPGMALDGWLARYWDMVTPQAHEAMHRWFAANPVTDDAHRRRVLATLLGRLARPEALESEIHLPGWTEEVVETLDAIYDSDLDVIASMPGVTLLEP